MNAIEKLHAQLINGEISRREFLKRASVLGVAAAAPGSLLMNTAHAATPKKGGHMRVATVQGSSTDLLDPTQLTSGMTNFLFYTIHSQLTEVLPNGEIAPLLAESFEIRNDPSEWVF